MIARRRAIIGNPKFIKYIPSKEPIYLQKHYVYTTFKNNKAWRNCFGNNCLSNLSISAMISWVMALLFKISFRLINDHFYGSEHVVMPSV